MTHFKEVSRWKVIIKVQFNFEWLCGCTAIYDPVDILWMFDWADHKQATVISDSLFKRGSVCARDMMNTSAQLALPQELFDPSYGQSKGYSGCWGNNTLMAWSDNKIGLCQSKRLNKNIPNIYQLLKKFSKTLKFTQNLLNPVCYKNNCI